MKDTIKVNFPGDEWRDVPACFHYEDRFRHLEPEMIKKPVDLPGYMMIQGINGDWFAVRNFE